MLERARNSQLGRSWRSVINHFKPLTVIGEGDDTLAGALHLPGEAPGLSWTGAIDKRLITDFASNVGWHRFWERDLLLLRAPHR